MVDQAKNTVICAAMIGIAFTATSRAAQAGQKPLLTLKDNFGVTALAFSPNGKTLASGTIGTESRHIVRLRLWDMRTGRLQHSLGKVSQQIVSLAFSPDGKTLASGSWRNKDFEPIGEAKLWDVPTGRLKRTLRGGVVIEQVAFSPDGKTLLCAGGSNKIRGGSVRLWDVRTGRLKRILKDSAFVETVAFSPDGRTIAGGSGYYESTQGRVYLWDARTGELRRTLKAHYVETLTFSPDGKILLTGDRVGDWTRPKGELKFRDARTGRLRRRMSHPYWIRLVAYSPDGRRLATTSSYFDTVRLYNVRTSRLQRILKGGSTFAFSPDSHTVATGNRDGTIKLWRIK